MSLKVTSKFSWNNSYMECFYLGIQVGSADMNNVFGLLQTFFTWDSKGTSTHDHIGSTKALKIELQKKVFWTPHFCSGTGFTIRTRQESQCRPYAGFFCWFLLVSKGYGGSKILWELRSHASLLLQVVRHFPGTVSIWHKSMINHNNNHNLDMCPWSPSSLT